MISLIIPAHNESAVIGRCLSALTASAEGGELEVIVIANGCSDDTAVIARAFGPPVAVIETPIASKPHALNLGDCAASAFPRFFVDADVVVDLPTLRRLAARLAKGDVMAIAPKGRFELSGCGWPVRSYYEVYGRLPSSREGIGGSGVYGLSEAGRRRFDRFPDITSDDGFVRMHFRPEERATLSDCYSTVYAPRTFRELIAIKTRSHYGTSELRRLMPQRFQGNGRHSRSALLGLLKRPNVWPMLLVYAAVKIIVRLRARLRPRGHRARWERDETSRVALDGVAARI